MQEIERMRRYIDRTGKPGTGYDLKCSEMIALASLGELDVCQAVCMAFNYGRAKGRREAHRAYDGRVGKGGEKIFR